MDVRLETLQSTLLAGGILWGSGQWKYQWELIVNGIIASNCVEDDWTAKLLAFRTLKNVSLIQIEDAYSGAVK